MARHTIKLLPFALQILCVISVNTFIVQGSKHCVWNSVEGKSTSCTNSVHCSSLITFQDINTIIPTHPEVEIYFCSTDYNLDAATNESRFIYKSSVTISGINPSSNIHCNNSNAGFFFRNVRKIKITNITLIKCGFHTVAEEFKIQFFTTINIINSSEVTIVNSKIKTSHGLGIVLVDNNGHLNILNSSFDENYDPDSKKPGGGILIESSTSQGTVYNIAHCNFTRNGAVRSNRTDVIDFVRGGGINAHFRAETSNINLTITKCRFESNRAQHGGGLCLSFQDSAYNVTVTVSNSVFHNNSAVARGGGVIAGYLQNKENLAPNFVLFKSCNFTENHGKMGGAMYFEFQNCTWKENEGTYGSAVVISRYSSKTFFKDGDLPVPSFKSCSFEKNLNKKLSLAPANTFQFGRGALYVNMFPVTLSGNTTFSENENNSAIYLFSSILEITGKSYILFERNVGYQGGAINLRGFSSICLKDEVRLKFDGNIAWNRGGAIFHSALIDPGHLTEMSCFMEYAGQQNKSVADRKISLHFVNTRILNRGLHQVTKPYHGTVYLFIHSRSLQQNVRRNR